jgi:hypothetical protein
MVPFIGAGVSRLAGGLGWNDFADRVLRDLVTTDQLTYSDTELLQNLSPRIKLSLADIFSRNNASPINYSNLFLENSANKTDLTKRMYGALSKLGKTFVTTNYDSWLDKLKTPTPPIVNPEVSLSPTLSEITIMKVVWQKDRLVQSLFDEDTVIHLHGSVKDPESMIVTVSDYLHHYANDRINDDENQVLTFLEKLFQQRCVLFIGYGLDEYDILEPIIMKAKIGLNSCEIRHYILQGFFSHEQRLFELLQTYYHTLGIELLPFRRDEKDREQLVDVLVSFAEQIPASTPYVMQELDDMDALLK